MKPAEEAATPGIHVPIPAAPPRLPRRSPRPRPVAGIETGRGSDEVPTGFLSGLRSLFRRRSKGARKVPSVLLDPVDCSVFAPAEAAAGESILMQVFAHRPEQGDPSAGPGRGFDSGSLRGGFRRLEIDVEQGAELRFYLDLHGLVVDEASRDLVWTGSPGVVEFHVSLPAGAARGTVPGTVHADLDGIPIGVIRFKLDVLGGEEAGKQRRPQPRGDFAFPFRKAYIACASSDRMEVLRRVQILTPLRIEFFQEALNLEPAARWEKQLYRYIDDCDLFLLFWSSAAKRSEWILREARYALERAARDPFGRPEIRPLLLESAAVEPPPDLAHLFFRGSRLDSPR
jgi:hypothetical protein